ncbi:MAG: PRC-barrel domain-containing protein, partial [Thermomicrobiales bacterium]|nr:PRC-barrel domain-containing protein [Thermomicrobiales bacterium]
MLVRVGDSVFGEAGKELGKVAGVVVNAGTMRATGILVHSGLFGHNERILAVSGVASSDEQGLHLSASGPVAVADSPIIDSEQIAFAQRVQPEETFIPAAGVGGPVYATEPNVSGPYPDESSFFEMAPIDPPPVEIISNLEENEVKLTGKAEAVSSQGHGLGHIASYGLGDMGLVDTITLANGASFT